MVRSAPATKAVWPRTATKAVGKSKQGTLKTLSFFKPKMPSVTIWIHCSWQFWSLITQRAPSKTLFCSTLDEPLTNARPMKSVATRKFHWVAVAGHHVLEANRTWLSLSKSTRIKRFQPLQQKLPFRVKQKQIHPPKKNTSLSERNGEPINTYKFARRIIVYSDHPQPPFSLCNLNLTKHAFHCILLFLGLVHNTPLPWDQGKLRLSSGCHGFTQSALSQRHLGKYPERIPIL